MRRPIVLTGFMSSGKTTVAAALGEKLACPALDLDDVIIASEGLTPKQIIDQLGEERFRETETRALDEVLRTGTAGVISLGGGAWILKRNRDLIARHQAITIWLDAPFALCWKRIPAGGGDRPFARNEQAARDLYQKRKPHYAQAEIRIEIDAKKSVSDIAAEIAGLIRLK